MLVPVYERDGITLYHGDARTAGRRAIGIELDPASIDKTITRLESR